MIWLSSPGMGPPSAQSPPFCRPLGNGTQDRSATKVKEQAIQLGRNVVFMFIVHYLHRRFVSYFSFLSVSSFMCRFWSLLFFFFLMQRRCVASTCHPSHAESFPAQQPHNVEDVLARPLALRGLFPRPSLPSSPAEELGPSQPKTLSHADDVALLRHSTRESHAFNRNASKSSVWRHRVVH